MSKRATLVLAALVVLLGGYILLFERDSLTSKELDERAGKVLATFVRDKVTRLELKHGAAHVLLAREPGAEGASGTWRLLAPLRTPADQPAVDQLLGELEWLSARRVLEKVSAQDRKAFGLDSPSFVLGYRVAGEDHSLRVGKPDVHGESYYAALDAEPRVYVVPKTLVEALDQAPGHFRDKQFVGAITTAWARRLALSGAHGTLVLEKQESTWWLLAEPKSHADAKRVEELLGKLDGLRAVRFLDGGAKAAALKALEHPERVVELRVVPDEQREDKKPERFLLRLGGACPDHTGERVAQAGEHGDPVCVLAEDAAVFDADEPELRMLRLFAADPSEIERLQLNAGAATLLLSREGENWKAQAGPAPDREAVEAWLAELAVQRATGVVPLKAFAPSMKLTLELMGGRKASVAAQLDEAGQRVLVRRDDEPVLASFGLALADLLAPFAGRFVGLSPWSGKQPSQVVALEAREGTLARKLVFEQGAWRKQHGAPPLKDDIRVRELVRELIKLRALLVVAEHARPEHGLAAPLAKLTFSLPAGAPLSLEIGAATPRGAYARVDGGPVLEIGPEAQRALHELAGGAPAPQPAAAAAPQAEHALDDEHGHDFE